MLLLIVLRHTDDDKGEDEDLTRASSLRKKRNNRDSFNARTRFCFITDNNLNDNKKTMNFIKIPQLLIAILLVAFSLSNAFAAGEEEIIAFQSELPSDASTYTIKQQGEHWETPGWRIEGYTKEYVTFRAWRYFFLIVS